MAIKDYQKRLDEWAQKCDPPYWEPHQMLARLAEEVGELSREINHLYGPKKKIRKGNEEKLSDEMADIIITIICMANSHNIDLDVAMEKVFDKINSRDSQRFHEKK